MLMASCAAVSQRRKERGRGGRERDDQQLRWIFNQSTLRFLTATAGSVRKLWRTLISMPASFTLCSRSSRVCHMKGKDRRRQTGRGEEEEVREAAEQRDEERRQVEITQKDKRNAAKSRGGEINKSEVYMRNTKRGMETVGMYDK